MSAAQCRATRTWRLSEAALAGHSGEIAERDLLTQTGEAGGNPEAGWRRGAKAWHAHESMSAVLQAGCDRIDAINEDNWNRCGCRVGRKCRGAASRSDDHGCAPADNIPGQCYKSIGLTIRGAEINRHGPAFGLFQALAKSRHYVRVKGLAVEKSDDRHGRLLGASGERQCRRSTE